MTTRRLVDDDRGATAIEYALLGGLVAAVIVAAVATLGTRLGALYGDANTRLTGEMEAPPPE